MIPEQISKEELYERTEKAASYRGMTVVEAAIKSGLQDKAIYNFKRHFPSSDKIAAVAKTLAVSVDYLLGLSDTMTLTPEDDRFVKIDLDGIDENRRKELEKQFKEYSEFLIAKAKRGDFDNKE